MSLDSPETNHFQTFQSKTGQQYIVLAPQVLPKDVEGPTAFLGKGAFGTVSVAFLNDEPLAVKMLKLNKSDPQYESTIAEISKEVAIMNQLGRTADVIIKEIPNSKEIDETADIIIEEDPNNIEVEVYVFQPFIPGMELTDYFKQLNQRSQSLGNENITGQLELLKEAIGCWIACLKATKQLHAAGVIHGDLHTGNILYDPTSQRATVIDFGMSHVLNADQNVVFVEEEAQIFNFHRAPETRELAVRREGYPPERVYDKSSDAYSLAIDFGVTSEFSDFYAPDFAGKEVAQLMKLFKELSQEPMIGGNGNAHERISIKECIKRLVAIQAQIDIRIFQKQIYSIPVDEMRARAKQHEESNGLAKQLLEQKLPANMQQEIKALAKRIKARRAEMEIAVPKSHESISAAPALRPTPILRAAIAAAALPHPLGTKRAAITLEQKTNEKPQSDVKPQRPKNRQD